MPIVTLRVDEDLLEEIDEEAEAFGYSSRSHYLRYLLRNRDLPGNDLDTARERLDEIEATLEEIVDHVEPGRWESKVEEDVPKLIRRRRAVQKYVEEGGPVPDDHGPDEESIERMRELLDRNDEDEACVDYQQS